MALPEEQIYPEVDPQKVIGIRSMGNMGIFWKLTTYLFTKLEFTIIKLIDPILPDEGKPILFPVISSAGPTFANVAQSLCQWKPRHIQLPRR